MSAATVCAPYVETYELAIESCPVCGNDGPCSYDADGRALIHTDMFNHRRPVETIPLPEEPLA